MKRKKNSDEIRAEHYLQTLHHTKLEYEPLGNVTPDFVIDGKIAVEVRRLNRNYKSKSNGNLVRIDAPLADNIDELHKNIQLLIDEKNEKIDKNFPVYSEWWLILVDYITNGMDTQSFEKVKKTPFKKHKFSKVIILSHEGNFRTFKL
ncbi:hypothetical protein [Sulfurimonas sp.]|uniref:hypothetical protein n=1 Tax=Sulfurimonas sp. TaxID=2022749 RepID=UPI003568EAD6